MIAKRAKFLENMQLLRDNGLRSQTALLLARSATTGDLNYMAQNQPLQQTAAEGLDKSLFESTIGLLGIDPSEENLVASRWFLPIKG